MVPMVNKRLVMVPRYQKNENLNVSLTDTLTLTLCARDSIASKNTFTFPLNLKHHARLPAAVAAFALCKIITCSFLVSFHFSLRTFTFH